MDGENQCIKRGKVYGGYIEITRTDDELIRDVLTDIEFGKKYMAQQGKPFPEIARIWILLPDRIIDHTI
jgi:hypothetical protein